MSGEAYRLPVVDQMLAYDMEYRTSLSRTLFLYLSLFKVKNAVASMLHLHRNSISYRIERASELFSLDLDDSVFARNLALSLELAMAENPSGDGLII